MNHLSVTLRRPRAGDEAEFLEMNRLSRSFHRPWAYPPLTPDGYHGFLDRLRHDDVEGFFVCERATGAISGAVVLSQIFRGAFESCYLGFYGSRATAGRGYMTDGVRLVLKEAFQDLKLHRVEANVQPANAVSLRLIEKVGFRREGFSPRYLKIGGRWRDHERWALLREEWKASRSR